MNCTLSLYKLPINLQKKNFVLESIETYLATLIPLTLSNYQYQRLELDKTIKINLSQDYQTDIDEVTKYNYLKITASVTATLSNKKGYYYYFITHARQVSQSCIELTLHMDVLNTFQYSNTPKNSTYQLSNKSLITREHKDRFYIESTAKTANLTDFEKIWASDCFGGGNTEENDSPRFVIDIESILGYVNINGYIGVYFLVDSEYGLKIYVDNELLYTCAAVTFQDLGIVVRDELMQDMAFINWEDVQNKIFSIQFLHPDDSIEWRYLEEEEDAYDDYFFSGGDCIIDKKAVLDVLELYRKIDRFQENIESITFKISEKELQDQDYDSLWYVAFSSANAVVSSSSDTQPIYVNPIQVDFIKSNGYKMGGGSASVVRIYPEDIPNFQNVAEYLVFTQDMFETGGYIEVAGVRINKNDISTKIFAVKKNPNDIFFAGIGASLLSPTYTNIRYIDCYKINSCSLCTGIYNPPLYATYDYKQQFFIGSGSETSQTDSPAFEDFDLTDPKLIKIINFPYCPRSDLVGKTEFSQLSDDLVWNSTLNTIELAKGQNTGFDRYINFGDNSPFKSLYLGSYHSFVFSKTMARDKKYESKLYHSDYYLPKFVYDSFTFGFRLEDMYIESYKDIVEDNFLVRYVCSGNVQSKFLFQFIQYVCDRNIQDYNNVLIVERNNEKALFNSAYINYIKNGGFVFDTKNNDQQKLVNALTITLSTIGAVGSFVSTPVTGAKGIMAGVGLAIAAATKTINAVASAQQNDRAIAQKLIQLGNQSTSVSSAEDIDLLKAYSNNKAKLCYYKSSDELINAIWDLFHYFGYKCNRYGLPSIDTRCNFNFVQGQMVLKDYTFNEDIADEITRKWAEGITFMHLNSGSYDFEQVYENIENSLLGD